MLFKITFETSLYNNTPLNINFYRVLCGQSDVFYIENIIFLKKKFSTVSKR